MTSKSYKEFSASRRSAPRASWKHLGDAPANEPVDVSIYLKPRQVDPKALDESKDPRSELLTRRSALHAKDCDLIREFAKENGLSIVAVEPAKRLVRLSGTTAQVETAFRTKLAHYDDGKRKFRVRSGALSLPEDLSSVVEAVLGLDTRPAAETRLVVRRSAEAATAYLPTQIASLYGFPASVNGAGQCIALIELGGGFNASDTQAAFKAMGLTPPQVIAVPVDGGKNKPKPDDGADGEVALDIQVAGGVAAGAKIAVYFAPNTDAGFVDAINAAVHDSTNTPSIISISWGSAESNWTQQAIQTMNSALQDAATVNVSAFVASGDNFATDGVNDGKAHVDFPASSPWATGCGGTSITVSAGKINNEQVWNDVDGGGGGGISDLFPVPSFQKNLTLPPSVNGGKAGRGVPDVAADAAPNTGYRVVVSGKPQVFGGTSAVAPLWAGLTALINSKAPKPVGFLLPFLYAHPTLLREITRGNNIQSGSTLGYQAGPGWNACTGLGVPNGSALFAALIGKS